MIRQSPYRAPAELSESPFEAHPYALVTLDEDADGAAHEAVAPSVFMRAEDFTRVHSSDDATPRWVAVTMVALAFAGVMTLSAVVAWIGDALF